MSQREFLGFIPSFWRRWRGLGRSGGIPGLLESRGIRSLPGIPNPETFLGSFPKIWVLLGREFYGKIEGKNLGDAQRPLGSPFPKFGSFLVGNREGKLGKSPQKKAPNPGHSQTPSRRNSRENPPGIPPPINHVPPPAPCFGIFRDFRHSRPDFPPVPGFFLGVFGSFTSPLKSMDSQNPGIPG